MGSACRLILTGLLESKTHWGKMSDLLMHFSVKDRLRVQITMFDEELPRRAIVQGDVGGMVLLPRPIMHKGSVKIKKNKTLKKESCICRIVHVIRSWFV